MTDDGERPHLREHLRELGRAVEGLGKDTEVELSEAPSKAKEGTKNLLARAGGVRRSSMRAWRPPEAGSTSPPEPSEPSESP